MFLHFQPRTVYSYNIKLIFLLIYTIFTNTIFYLKSVIKYCFNYFIHILHTHIKSDLNQIKRL